MSGLAEPACLADRTKSWLTRPNPADETKPQLNPPGFGSSQEKLSRRQVRAWVAHFHPPFFSLSGEFELSPSCLSLPS